MGHADSQAMGHAVRDEYRYRESRVLSSLQGLLQEFDDCRHGSALNMGFLLKRMLTSFICTSN